MIYTVKVGKLINRSLENDSSQLSCPMCRCVNCPGNPCPRSGYTNGK